MARWLTALVAALILTDCATPAAPTTAVPTFSPSPSRPAPTLQLLPSPG